MSIVEDKFVVHKFGGTSVGNAECFTKVSDIIAGVQASRIAVVVSAIGGKPKVTDLLIQLLHLAKERDVSECDAVLDTIRDKHQRVITALLAEDVGCAIMRTIELDLKRISELLRAITIMHSYNENLVEFISGHGEIWSAQILAAVLTQRAAKDGKQHVYRFVDARDFLVVDSDNEHGGGPVVQYQLTTEKIERIVRNEDASPHTHLVITGFICSTTEGVMTTLQRDGSDFTASICGRVLRASSITIWTDVSGVLSSDPRRVPDSAYLPEISYEEAMELAYFGAKVIHPKTMTPAIVEGIPIYIRNTFEPDHPGTKICHRSKVALTRSASNNGLAPTARSIVSGFSTVDDLALFNIEGSGMVGVHGTSSRLFSALDRIKVNVVLIAQASSEHSICFAVPMSRADEVQTVVDECFFKEIHHGLIERTEFIAPISIIAAVGDNMSQTPGVCRRFFGALGRAKINVLAISQGSSERNISAVVHYEDSAAALRAVHSAFFLSDQTLSVGIVGLERDQEPGTDDATRPTSIGHELLEQYHQQCEFLRARFNVDIRIRAVATHSTKEMLLDHSGEGITTDVLRNRPHSPSNAALVFEPFDHDRFLRHVCADHLPHWLVVDVSNCGQHVQELYPKWLASNVHLITSNLNVAAASEEQHRELRTSLRTTELTYDTEACLAIGVPVFNTLKNFVQTGDTVQRVEFSGSRVFNAILHAAAAAAAATSASLSSSCATTERYQHTAHLPALEAIITAQVRAFRKFLSIQEILDDVSGQRSAKKAVLLARELGFAAELADVDMAATACWSHIGSAVEAAHAHNGSSWDDERLLGFLLSHAAKLADVLDRVTAQAVGETHSPALRLIANVDACTGALGVKIEALAADHTFASLSPEQCAFAFHTTRHARHPVVVLGPIADAAITAGTIFGSILNLARNCGAREAS